MATIKSADIKPSKLKDGGMFEIDYGDSKDTVKIHVLEDKYLEFQREAGKDSFNLILTLDKGTMRLHDGMGNQYTCTNRNGEIIIRKSKDKKGEASYIKPQESDSIQKPLTSVTGHSYKPEEQRYQDFLEAVKDISNKDGKPARSGELQSRLKTGGKDIIALVKYGENLGDIIVNRKDSKRGKKMITGISINK